MRQRVSNSWGSLPTSAWLIGGAGVLLAVLGLSLSVWSKSLVKESLRFGSTEVAARHLIETEDFLEELLRKVDRGEPSTYYATVWQVEDGAVVSRTPAEAPDPPALLLDVIGTTKRGRYVSLQGAELRVASWSPARVQQLREGKRPRTVVELRDGVLIEWDLERLAAQLRREIEADPGRYRATLLSEPNARPPWHAQTDLALPEPLSPWKVSVGLRDFAAERSAVRLQTFVLVSLVLWLLGVLAFGLWRGARRERAERELRVQRELLLVRTTHELQTPLALLRAACESIENGAVEGTDRDRALGIVVREEARLTAAIRRLLRHLRLENAPLELGSVGEVAEATANDEREALAAHGLELELSVSPAARSLRAPQAFVADLVRELCANARKHARGARRLRLSVAAQGNSVRLVYSDDGPGFAPGAQTSEGLGLLLLRDGLGQLGGTLTRGAGSDGGAQIEVSFPCQRTPTLS